MTPKEKQQAFHEELKQLLLKYKAEMTIEDFGNPIGNKIVVDFDYDESLFEEHNTGIIDQLILGLYVHGRS